MKSTLLQRMAAVAVSVVLFYQAPLVGAQAREMPLTGAEVKETPLVSAQALTGSESKSLIREEVITVVGTRTERTLNQVGATVTVINEEDIDRQIVRDVADLVRYEPGVSVAGTGSRFGLSGFNIRGIGGNRVLTLVDGVRVADQFDFGPFLDARRDFVDVDTLEMVEIARGPISSLYGSDALGGVVSFTTRGPARYVNDHTPFHADAKAGFSTDDDSLATSVNLAAGNSRLAGLLSVTRREGEATETSGRSGFTAEQRQQADPQDNQADTLSAKLMYAPWEGHEFVFGYDRFQGENTTRILSDYGAVLAGFGPPTIINTRDAQDEREREKLMLTYTYTGEGPVSQVLVRVYHQDSFSEQRTDESRTGASGALTRFRHSEFEQQIEGAYLQLASAFDSGGWNHELTYGAEYYTTDSVSLRTGGTFDVDGVPQFEFSPLPTRDFPVTRVKQTALFLQDEISLLDGALRLTPGLRYDRFDADAKPDAVYLAGNPGTPAPEDYEDAEMTTSFSVVYQFNEGLSGFARYSEGFRAPPYDDVNVGFTNPIGGYKTIANPGLVSETSEGRELGLRWSGERAQLSVAIYENSYKDFIEPLSIAPRFLSSGGIDPADGFLTFQSVNRAEVEIKGAELSGSLDLGGLAPALEDFSVRLAIAYATGEDLEADEPLNSVDPIKAVLGVEYDAATWGVRLVMTAVDGKQEDDIAGTRLASSGYGLIDLLGYIDFGEKVTLNVGLFNLTDRAYIRWADTVSIGTDSPMRFSQPGFNAGATVKVHL